jgi:uncharacterized OB-fold protein
MFYSAVGEVFMAQVPIAGGMLALEPGAPRLLASRCGPCGALAFPAASGCARCGSTEQETVRLSPGGKIWTWTSQEFRPVSPPYTGPETAENFTPYYVGFVELAEGLCVETRLTGFGGRPPRIGQEVSLVALPFRTDEDGNEVVLPAFEPASGGHGA